MSDRHHDVAREAARSRDGRVGAQQRAEATVELRAADPDPRDVAAAAGRGRTDVASEVEIMVTRPDLPPDYNLSSDWRRLVLGRRRAGGLSPADLATVPAAHALRCRDFCFTQAARFGGEARVAPDDRDRAWMADFDWAARVEDHAYSAALADAYAYWACAFDAGGEPDPRRVTALVESTRRLGFEHSLAPSFRGDPAPDRTAEWEAATGGSSEVTERL